MNDSETICYNWLISEKGYMPEDIIFQRNKSPDFLCADGMKYEAKMLNGNSILFSKLQMDTLTDDTIILVVNKSRKEIIKQFEMKNYDMISFPKLYICDRSKYIQIQLYRETLDLLKSIGHMGESYDDLINRILNERREHQ